MYVPTVIIHAAVLSELNGSDEILSKSIEEWEATKKAHNTDQLTKLILTS